MGRVIFKNAAFHLSSRLLLDGINVIGIDDFDQKAYKVEARAALIAALGEHI